MGYIHRFFGILRETDHTSAARSSPDVRKHNVHVVPVNRDDVRNYKVARRPDDQHGGQEHHPVLEPEHRGGEREGGREGGFESRRRHTKGSSPD